ncbi:hypothetical protein RDWZM_009654 [Blomia tropicalis]|uniref:MOSC domain-containing protein n=1 Tax=Blomia tropicalis TaxID=40697 RepID=A0A9Q0M3Y2_BLOTA|nr:hypothetical protein RDWZM_009654 [Blomia tropicalis]
MNKKSGILKLIIYPIKSLPGIEVDEIDVTRSGMQCGEFHDRSYILLNEHKNMITQRMKPKLALIRISIHDNELWLDAPSLETLKIPCDLDTSGNEVFEFSVWGQETKGVDCGDSVNQWFTRFLGAQTKLVKFDSNMPYRGTGFQNDNQLYNDENYPIVYQDGSPTLLINQSSIDDLNKRLDRSSQVTYRNFRPNILIRSKSAFDEDVWKEIQLGEIRLDNVKPCDRCTLTTVNPDKGVKHPNMEPLRTLKSYRIIEETKHLYKDAPLFGVNLVAQNFGTIKLNDEMLIF